MAKGLNSKIYDFYLKPLPGMNSKTEDLELATTYVELAQNCRFEEEPGAAVKRPPMAKFNGTTIGTGAIQSAYRYYTSGGVKKWIVIHGTQAYVGADATGAFTSIRTGLTTGKKASFVTYKDILISSNGYDNMWCYDGSSDNVTWELGSCKAVLGTAAGNLDQDTYYYAVVFNTSADGSGTSSGITGAVSNTVTCDASYQKIELSNIPLGPSGTASRILYRTEGGASSLKKLAVIGNNTATTYTDNIADGTLSDAYPSVADDMPVGKILKLHRERLFITGDPSNVNKIYYSASYLPHYIRQTTNLDYMQIDENDGDEIVGIPIQLSVMVCVKKNTIRKLHITAPTSGADPTTWYAEDPSSWNGCAAWQTVVQTPFGVAYLGWDHWYIYDGATSKPIIDEFDTYEILDAQYTNVVAHWDKGDLVWSYTDRTAASNVKDRVARYNLKRKALSFDTFTVGSGSVGMECFASRYGDAEHNELFMGDAVNGFLYKTDQFDIEYALRSKTEANAGSLSNIFIGGTEASPAITIGATTSAVAIPDNVCIFWDNPNRFPENSNGSSAGWTEITDKDDKYIKIDTGTAGTTGTVGTTITTAAQIDEDATEIDYVNYRVFYKNSNTTEYTYPDGSIIMYDQSSTPTGFVDTVAGRYVRINSDLSDGLTGKDYIYSDDESASTAEALDNTVEFRFIKKIGETDTWDGLSKYAYLLYYDTGFGFTACTPVNATNAITDTAHGMANGERVHFAATTIPTGLSTSTIYYVVGKTDDTFQVSLTEGGAAVTFSDDGDTVTYEKVRNDFYDVSADYDNCFIKTANSGPTQTEGDDTGYNVNLLHLPSTYNSYSGLTDGSNAIDGDDDTYSTGSFGGGYESFNESIGVYSTHTWEVAKTITEVSYKATAAATMRTHYTANTSVTLTLEYTTDGETWSTLGSITDTDSDSANGGGSETSCSSSASLEDTWTGSQAGVTGIRMYGATSGNGSGGETSGGGNVKIYTLTCECEPYDTVTFNLVKKLLGKHKDYNTAINTQYTSGTWTSPTLKIQANTLKKLFWNESILAGTTNCVISTRTGDYLDAAGTAPSDTDGGATVGWHATTLSNPNGSDIGSTAANYFQYKIDLTASDTRTSNPSVIFASGYCLKFDYRQQGAKLDDAVEFRYKIGVRNFKLPLADKIFKKIGARYEGTQGSILVKWETENTTDGEFTVDLSTLPERWDSFFPSSAFGKEITLEFYKNDLYDLKLKEFRLYYTPEPILI